jgi:hypothetical protein
VAEAALALPAPARTAHLDAACAGDAGFRAEVERLVRGCHAAEHARDFLGEPAQAFAGAFVEEVVRGEAARADALRAEIADVLGAALAGRYAIGPEVGCGGMATVYLARDERHGRPVAIKVMHPELAPARGAERFGREIGIAAALQHPNILPLYDSGVAARLLYYVMPYVEGESLRGRLSRHGRASIGDAVRLVSELADALAYAHAHGVVHRDLKPENVLLSGGHALVADFGVAKALAAAAGTGDSLTATGFALGTPGYMAPEQASGGPPDARSDLYALGVVAFELLIGTRPDAGAGDVAREIRRHRAEVPPGLATLVARLLARSPADRPQSATEVLHALSAAPGALRTARLRLPQRRVRAAVAAGIAMAVAVVGWRVFAPPAPTLDANRIVIFPLSASGGGLPAHTGEDVATLLGHALESTAPLRWVDAADLLDAPQRADVRLVSATTRRAISRRHGAAFYIDGSVVRYADSVVVGLRLHSVGGDSLVARRSQGGGGDTVSAAQLGVRAVAKLLVPLLEPGRRVDVSAMTSVKPAAVAAFLQGERAYRASQMARALERYGAALAHDSAFPVAALGAAQAANWLERSEDADAFVRRALRRAEGLPAHRATFARGLQHYLGGAGDSAVGALTQTIAFDSLSTESWMLLGEVYRHLLPKGANLDSLAERAFVRAKESDGEFTPPLFHLAELALRRGAIARADTLARAYNRANPDSVLQRPLDAMLACVRSGSRQAQWQRMAAVDPLMVLEAGETLAGGAAHPACGRDAFWAVLTTRSASEDLRWAALFGLQSLLIATGRDTEAVRLFQSPAAAALDADALLLLDASAGAAVQERAAEIADRLGRDYPTLSSYRLWLLGCWEAWRGRRDRTRDIGRALARHAESSHSRDDSLFAASIAARVALGNGDTTAAIRALRQLVPSAARPKLMWFPWEALGGERLLLAELLLARGDVGGARQAAGQLAGSHPLVYLIYLRPSLVLQARAAEMEGDTVRAAQYRERLAALAREAGALPL